MDNFSKVSKKVTLFPNGKIFDTLHVWSNETLCNTLYNNTNKDKEDTILIYHNKPITSVLKELETNSEHGLSGSDVAILLAEHGDNKLKEKKEENQLPAFSRPI